MKRTIAHALGEIAGGIGALLGLAFVLAQVGLFAGGISYRKDCPNAEGVKSSWSFTWFAPIPYLFRPSEPGCSVHTGARVALNSIGIASFAEASAASLADKAVEDTRGSVDQDTAYWVKLRAYLEDYYRRNKNVEDIDKGLASVDGLLGQLDGLHAGPRYASAHGDLVTALRLMRTHGAALKDAAQRQDEAAYKKEQQRVLPDAKRVQGAMSRLDMIHAGK